LLLLLLLLQAYGARRYSMLGVVLQRARLICWCACLPVAVLWNFMGPLLLLLGQVGHLQLIYCYLQRHCVQYIYYCYVMDLMGPLLLL
jgi:hypothetical protein